MNSLQNELDYRAAKGRHPITLQALKSRLAALGYRLRRDMDSASLNRYMTGERAGRSYPAVNMYVVQADNGLSFANIEARRDANFKKLQALRMTGELFAVSRGRILEL